MLIVLFQKPDADRLAGITAGDVVVHAHPGSRPISRPGLKEYYLEDYGSETDGLAKITLPEIAHTLTSHNRIEIL